jgi:hypothetical protein
MKKAGFGKKIPIDKHDIPCGDTLWKVYENRGSPCWCYQCFNLIGIGILAGVTLSLSQKQIYRMAEENTVNLAVQGSEKIKSWLGMYMDISRTLAHMMEGYKSIPIPERRLSGKAGTVLSRPRPERYWIYSELVQIASIFLSQTSVGISGTI